MSTRRNFLIASGAFSLCANLRTPLGAEAKPLDKFDLIIKSGEVIDPSQGLRGKRDIGIRHGRVAALEMDIPVDPAQGRRGIIDATGKIVTPGLVDLHTHIWPSGNILGISADQLVNTQGTTTLVSAGDVGASSFAAFRRNVVAQSHARIFAFINLANIGLTGFPVPELTAIDFAQVDVAAKVIAENTDVVLGVKVRMSDTTISPSTGWNH